MSKETSKVWLVTGCSTGFGRYIAEHLLESGEKVVVTARKTDKIADLKQKGDALILPLDVIDRAQCRKAVEAAEAHFGRVDVLINNAGIGFFGAVEETEEADARRLFEVNFFGTANTIHAVLPGMRTRRSGTIVNLTSIGGIVGFTGVGYYCASKFAVEGLSDTLRTEVEPLGIKVMAVEPSGFRTEWAGSSSEAAAIIADYDGTAGEARRAYHASVGHQAGDPARAAKAIREAVLAAKPPHHLLLGNDAVDAALEKIDALRANVTAWEGLSRSADFPVV
ncbi:short-chain dehydrogenase/reductase [Sphingomonas oleivorans]|uniref:Short-chain dehydrogenase/reductase n=1 Tax=Sphingomonas oleivorans TaxID=1735121 RepID=A0A2T5FU95_9SPHN|nr:oxidoreductase [Sphingomonas oleivorans]PTQ07846.1 short-chain dehydrogenase/reductase [Sphingomonas oleivorans]